MCEWRERRRSDVRKSNRQERRCLGCATPASVVFTALVQGYYRKRIATAATGTSNAFGATSLSGGTAVLSTTYPTSTTRPQRCRHQCAIASGGRTSGHDWRNRQSPAECRRRHHQPGTDLTGAEDGVRAADIPSTVATLAKYSILEQTGYFLSGPGEPATAISAKAPPVAIHSRGGGSIPPPFRFSEEQVSYER